MKNKETLEEVAERILANNIDGLQEFIGDQDLFLFYKDVIKCYGKEMAKWQEQNSDKKYSDEVIDFASWVLKQDITSRGEGNYVNEKGVIVTVKNLFEQFKKK